jgi:hypothetical protein
MWIWWDSVSSEHMWALWYLVLSKNHCRYFRLAVEPSIIEFDGMMNQEQSCSKIGGRKNGLKTKWPAHLWGYDSYCFTSYITNVSQYLWGLSIKGKLPRTSLDLGVENHLSSDCDTKTCFLGSWPSTIASGREWSPGGGHDHWFLRLVYLGIQKLLSVKDPIYIKWWHSGDNPIVSRITHSLLSLQC